MKNLTMIALLGAASVMLAGCGEDKKEEPAAPAPAAVEAPATPAATETAPAAVEETAAPVEEATPAAVEEQSAAPAEQPVPAASTEMTPSVSTTDEAQTTPQQ